MYFLRALILTETVPTFREKCVEVCKQRLVTREELTAHIRWLIGFINQVDFKFKSISHIPSDAPNVKSEWQRDLAARVYGRSGAREFEDVEAKELDWQTNPRYLVSQFLCRLVEILETAPVGELEEQVEVCLSQFKTDYPRVDFQTVIDDYFGRALEEVLIREKLDKCDTFRIAFAACISSLFPYVRKTES